MALENNFYNIWSCLDWNVCGGCERGLLADWPTSWLYVYRFNWFRNQKAFFNFKSFNFNYGLERSPSIPPSLGLNTDRLNFSHLLDFTKYDEWKIGTKYRLFDKELESKCILTTTNPINYEILECTQPRVYLKCGLIGVGVKLCYTGIFP